MSVGFWFGWFPWVSFSCGLGGIAVQAALLLVCVCAGLVAAVWVCV